MRLFACSRVSSTSILRAGRGRRCYSDLPKQPRESPQRRSSHAQWYADVVPGMIPVALLGSAVYLGLQLTQVYLSNEKYMDEAEARISALETDIDQLRAERDRRKVSSSISPGPQIVDKRPSRWWFTGA